MKESHHSILTLILGLAALSVGCEPGPEAQVEEGAGEMAEETAAEPAGSVTQAIAVLHPTEGSEARGTVSFRQVGNGIAIGADVSGLEPGAHGFHIHEFGDCTAADGTSAGGHFNPGDMRHGAPADAERHVGDLGNLTADESGMASYERTDGVVAFEGAESIIGRAVIVHAGQDDLTSQPTGAAGARVACGVIGIGDTASDM